MVEPLLTLADMLAILDLHTYDVMPQSRETFFRLQRLRERAMAGDNDAVLQAMNRLEREEIVRVFAAGSISPHKVTLHQLEKLGNYLLRDESTSMRLAIAGTLRRIPLPETIPLLVTALVRSHEPHLRTTLAYALRDAQAPISWQNKVNLLLDTLQNDGRFREHLEMSAFITAILPPDDDLRQSRFLLADYLVSRAPNREERMIGILAGLILESCGGNINRANERVDTYAPAHNEDNKTWQALRAEISSLLTPAELRANLEETFQKPLTAVHREIQSSWQTTIRDVRRGLKWRIYLSFLVPLGAIGLLAVSIWLIGWRDAWLEGLTGAAIALITLALYGGPIKEARQALTDIGVANAVYTAFVQRMLEISHIYTRFYLDGKKPSYYDVAKSSKLINEVVQDTVKALREDRPATLDDLIDQYS